MKRTFTAWMFLLSACITSVFAQGTAFTYQGRLNDGGSPANGTYDFRFRLASDPLANNYIGSAYLTNSIAVAGGLFSATPDFGPGIFTGSNYWLEVDVRTNGAGLYTALTPLQPLTPAPYAVFANSSSNLLGLLPAGQLSGPISGGNLPASASFTGTVTANTFTGNGVNVSNVNAVALNGLSSSNFWQLGGNNVGSGQILGSTNSQALEVRVANQRALLIVTNPADSAGLIGGSPANLIDPGVIGAVIAGGGTTNFLGESSSNRISANFGSISGGSGNWIQPGADHSIIGNGWDNWIGTNSYQSVIGGGETNSIQANSVYNFIGGGLQNSIQTNAAYNFIGGGGGNSLLSNSFTATLSGGNGNTSGGFASTISGGQNNRNTNNAGYETIGGGLANVVTGFAGTVPGGRENVAGIYSLAAGFDAQATNYGSFVFADFSGFEVPFGSLVNNSFNVRAMGGARFVTGGAGITLDGFPLLASGGGSGITIQNNSSGAPNVIEGAPYNFAPAGILGATIAGGGATNYFGSPFTNSVTANFGTVGGGAQNTAGAFGVVAGGDDNFALGNYSTVSGGYFNSNNSPYGVIGGGENNIIDSAYVSFIGGGAFNNILVPAPTYAYNAIAGGALNLESNVSLSFIGGGLGNTDYTSYSVIAGGATNLLSQFARYSFIGAGQNNTIFSNSDHSVIGGGLYNFIGTNAVMSVIAGGASNTIFAKAFNATIVGGSNNFVNASSGTLGGGVGNSVAGSFATVGGGINNHSTNFAATVSGGENNTAGGYDSTVGGGGANVASGNNSSVDGGEGNIASGFAAVVGGGGYNNFGIPGNIASGDSSTVAGGSGNQATNLYATVPGGYGNVAGGVFSFALGQQAQALHQGSFVWADSQNATFSSAANDQFLIRAKGGVGIDTTPLEGDLTLGTNIYLKDHPIYLRGNSGADHNHGLAYNGQTTTNFGTGSVQVDGPVLWGFTGGALGIMNGGAHAVLGWSNGVVSVAGNVFANGVQLTSDRNAKEHFTPLNPQSVLAKVSALPITEWNYKSEDATDKHIGPMAQDFHEAFGLNGADDKHISAVDESGVALAAIQGLDQEVKDLKTENAELKQRLAALEKLIAGRK